MTDWYININFIIQNSPQIIFNLIKKICLATINKHHLHLLLWMSLNKDSLNCSILSKNWNLRLMKHLSARKKDVIINARIRWIHTQTAWKMWLNNWIKLKGFLSSELVLSRDRFWNAMNWNIKEIKTMANV
jgi:hypothetical protein